MTAVTAASHGPTLLGQPRRRVIAVRGWAVAVFVYVAAVFHRSSLGVAGLRAEERFGITAGQLSTFVLLQLGVYAAMQIPTGILVDRFGPRRLLVWAAGLMAVAQLLFAVAPSYPVALLARTLLGAGDALTFVSVLRFASSQFSAHRFPVVVAITGVLGSTGNLIATVPLSAALAGVGWTPTFLVAGSVSIVAGTAVWLLLPRAERVDPVPLTWTVMRTRTTRVTDRVATAWRLPGTRAGFWLHFACMSSTTVFGVLWGFPFLVDGLGYDRGRASTILLFTVLAAVVAGPLIGVITGRYPVARVPLALGVCVTTLAGWVAVLLPDRPAPGVVLAVAVVMAVGGPASAIGFALARDYNGPAVVGTATGVVNVGGFVAAITGALAVGWLLDRLGSSPSDYRIAMVAVAAVQLFGTVQVVRWWLRARAAVLCDQAAGAEVPVRLTRHRWDLSTVTPNPHVSG